MAASQEIHLNKDAIFLFIFSGPDRRTFHSEKKSKVPDSDKTKMRHLEDQQVGIYQIMGELDTYLIHFSRQDK